MIQRADFATHEPPLPIFLPRHGERPPEPCPELLTEKEAVRYLRLDETGVKHPNRTLRRYREMGVLKGTIVGRCVLYRRSELEAFLDLQTERLPR